ncbi:MAG TPA: glycosyltransferase family 2 protein [Spirochaetia bacterium]|nr:glycosyltransferase family 2 protein [Spirochaetia bacterium]
MLGQILPVVFILGALYFLLLSASNVLWLRLSSLAPRLTHGRKVSVLVPARNEEKNIAQCLDSLLEQTYANYEILVLDDQSSDGTWTIIEDYGKRHADRVRAVRGEPLPGSGWSGKTHAMQQLARQARGDYLMFTDADTVHGRQSISWAVTNIEAHGADCISGYVFQELETLGELFIVPTTYIMSAIVLPLWLIGVTHAPGLSFAIGQLIVFRRRAFDAIGGYAAVSGQISDDVAIARELKKAGYREVFLDMRRHVRCRMYSGYRSSFNGISKNLYDFAKRRLLFLASAITLLVGLVVLPFALLPVLIVTGNPALQFATLCVILFLAAWMLALYDRGLPWWAPLLYPIMFLHLLYMAWWSILQAFSGHAIVWKGRALR